MKNFAVLSLLPLLCYGQVTIDLSTDAVEEIETCEANAKVGINTLFSEHETGQIDEI